MGRIGNDSLNFFWKRRNTTHNFENFLRESGAPGTSQVWEALLLRVRQKSQWHSLSRQQLSKISHLHKSICLSATLEPQPKQPSLLSPPFD